MQTGEEGEEVQFDFKCKLYRYDAESEQWKERGTQTVALPPSSPPSSCPSPSPPHPEAKHCCRAFQSSIMSRNEWRMPWLTPCPSWPAHEVQCCTPRGFMVTHSSRAAAVSAFPVLLLAHGLRLHAGRRHTSLAAPGGAAAAGKPLASPLSSSGINQHRSMGILFLITCALAEPTQRGRAAPASGTTAGFLAVGSFPCCPSECVKGSSLLMGAAVAQLHCISITTTCFI